MTPEQFQRVEVLFHQLRPLPDERRKVVLDSCGDPVVRDDVLKMLEHPRTPMKVRDVGSDADRILGGSTAANSEILVGTTVGPYRIVKQLPEGGMGMVYIAEQSAPIHRRVALKVIKPGMDTKQTLARFETEREALALMNHPNVARVLDAGATEKGRPFFVMEYVEGQPITNYCDAQRLNLPDRLRLFIEVCQAVQHAHQKGIIHRDIKPSNVLVTEVDGKPTPKVIDFGIAKATQQRLTERTFFTEKGQFIGTPGYMSPEQAEMTGVDIDTRSDVYSLGALLYELLIGVPPFENKIFREASLAEIQRIIREVDPPKPSTRVGTLDDGSARAAENRNAEPRTLTRTIRGDLDWIVMKCLEKDRTRRYAAANDMVLEIQRFLINEPVDAGPPSATYRFRKFARRNKVPLGVATLVFVVLLGAAVFSTRQYLTADAARRGEAEAREDAEKDRDAAETARDEAEQVTKFLTDTLAAADPFKQGKDVTVREVLDQASEKIGERFAGKPLVEACLKSTVGLTYHALGDDDRAESHLADAVVIYRRILGEHDPRTRLATNMLSVVMGNRGNYGASEALFRSTLEIQRRVLGEENPNTLDSMNDLAIALWPQGRYTEAEELHRKALEIQRRVLGEEHPDTLNSMNYLALVLGRQGRYTEAEELYRKTLEIDNSVLGERHMSTLALINNLAINLGAQGRYSEAEELHRKTLEIQRRTLGEENPDTLMTMFTLANVLNDEGRYPEAEELHRKTLEIRRRVLGDEHPFTLMSMKNLSEVLALEGRYSEAEELLRKALEIRRRVLGKEHPHTLGSMWNLADLLLDKSQYIEAEELAGEALAIWDKKGETITATRWLTTSTRGGALTGLGRFAEAEPLLVGSFGAIKVRSDLSPAEKRRVLDRVVRLYDAWDAAEPGKDYAEKAAGWRMLLSQEKEDWPIVNDGVSAAGE